VEFFMPLHISNVLPVGADGKPVRHDHKPKAI
jgi:hypothetical protein